MLDNLTVVIPYWQGRDTINETIDSIPPALPILIVDDLSDIPLGKNDLKRDCEVVRLNKKEYFAGAINAALSRTKTDVLVLNQDITLKGEDWLDLIAEKRGEYGIIGEKISGIHPAWPEGYAHGTFWYLRRDLIENVGLLNQETYPLWGSTCEYQLRACRKGYKALPIPKVPGFTHLRGNNRFGSSISELLKRNQIDKEKLIRTPPLVSVVVSCYNYGRYIPDLVKSMIGGDTSLGKMQGQTLQSFEIVICDDASTDNSWEIIQSVVDPWKGIRAIRHTKNQGTAVAFNTATRNSYGKYIAAMCADDMMESPRLEKLCQTLEQNQHSIVYDDMMVFRGGKRVKAYGIKENYDFDELLERNRIPSCIMLTRQAWKEVGGWPESFGNGREDWAMAVALGEKGYCGIRVEGADYLYRREKQNRTETNTNPRSRQFFMEKMIRTFPHLYRGERPMGCCGDGKKQPKGARRGATMIGKATPNEGTTMVQYIGSNWGTGTFYAKGSSHRYRFGKARAIGPVYDSDLQSFLDMRDENGKKLFKLMTEPVILGITKPIIVPPAQPETKMIETAFVKIVDPRELTLQQIKDSCEQYPPSPDEIEHMIDLERSGKARQSILNYLTKLQK